MWSRYTPQEAVKFQYRQGDKLLEDEEDLMQLGIGDFSLRVITGLSKACGPKYEIWLQVMKSKSTVTSNNIYGLRYVKI